MAVYQFNQAILQAPEKFADDLKQTVLHLVSWRINVSDSALNGTGQNRRMRVTTASALSADQLSHLNLTLISP